MRKIVIFAAGSVLLLLLINVSTVVGLTWPITEFSIAKAGAFGDSFGWLNAVFSGFAFLGVMWTLIQQQEELKESRQASHIERFEGTFFRLLELLRKNLEEIRIATPDGGQPVCGVEALAHCTRKVVGRMQEHDKWLATPNGRLVYEQLLKKSALTCPPQARYLGTLETLLEIIERDLPNQESRAPYWDIIAQQMTSGEARYLLFWALRGKKPDRLVEHINRAPAILKRIAALGPNGSQRSLYKRLYNLDLAPAAGGYPPLFKPSEYKTIRRKAREELEAVKKLRVKPRRKAPQRPAQQDATIETLFSPQEN